VQDQLARGHHARPSSLATWSVFQVVPKMYSFGHRIWFGREPFVDDSRAQAPSLWLNHYPIRDARFEHGRADIVGRGESVYLLLRTGYQGHRWESRYVVRVEDGGLVLELLEATP